MHDVFFIASIFHALSADTYMNFRNFFLLSFLKSIDFTGRFFSLAHFIVAQFNYSSPFLTLLLDRLKCGLASSPALLFHQVHTASLFCTTQQKVSRSEGALQCCRKPHFENKICLCIYCRKDWANKQQFKRQSKGQTGEV